jgi:hypothetical protein
MKDIFVIGFHQTKWEQLDLLENLCINIRKANRDILLSTHTEVPSRILDMCKFVVLDRENPLYYYWDLDTDEPLNSYYEDWFTIHSNYLGFGRVLKHYGVASTNLLRNAVRFLNGLYDIVHWIEYDTNFLIESENNIFEIINSQGKSVFYNHPDHPDVFSGSRLSFLINNFNEKYLRMSNEDMLKEMSNFGYVTESFVFNEIISGSKVIIEMPNNLLNLESTKFNKDRDLEWSFYEENGYVKMFVRNLSDKRVDIEIKINENPYLKLETDPLVWHIVTLGNAREYFDFGIYIDGYQHCLMSLNESNYKGMVESVKFITK